MTLMKCSFYCQGTGRKSKTIMSKETLGDLFVILGDRLADSFTGRWAD